MIVLYPCVHEGTCRVGLLANDCVDAREAVEGERKSECNASPHSVLARVHYV